MPTAAAPTGRAAWTGLGLMMIVFLGVTAFARATPTAPSPGPVLIRQPGLWPDLVFRLQDRPTGPVAVQITAREHSWVRLELDGQPLYEGTLEPGNTRTWAATGRLTAHLGNPQGLQVAVQGQVLPLDWEGPVHVRIEG